VKALVRVILVSVVLLLPGCGVELAPTGLECQRTPADGREEREGEDPLAPGGPLEGVSVSALTPAAVGEIAEDAGFGVTYRNHYTVGPEGGSTGYAECWCVPPEGRVMAVAYDSIGRVMVAVDSGQHRTAVRPQPEMGWGCRQDAS
jgi:hypothetical protein